jgi:hypothetical protein
MASMDSAVSPIIRETRMTNSVKDGRVLTVVVIKIETLFCILDYQLKFSLAH